MKETLEEFVRESFKRIKSELYTQVSEDYKDTDYLHIMNYANKDEEKEIRDILKNIEDEIERLFEIQDDIYGR